MARVLIVGGGCRGLRLAGALRQAGHVVRVTTRSEAHRRQIEAVDAECWIGTPDRLSTLRESLDSVAIVCWLLASATGPEEQVRALHSSRLEFFLGQAIDTSIRGFIYESSPGASLDPGILQTGAEITRRITSANAIPRRVIDTPLDPPDLWLSSAMAAVAGILSR